MESNIIYNIREKYRLTLILTIISFLIFVYALIMISVNPSKGYEISIYLATPAIFWIAIICGLINGFFLVIYSFFNTEKNKIWKLGIFEIVFCNTIMIFLYALRGYILYLGRGDVATYVGMAKDINIYGYFPDYNFYPITSIIISQMSQLLSISIIDISKYLSSLFFVLYVLVNYCWAKSFIEDRNFIMSVLISTTPIFFAWFITSIYHQLLSVMILPLFFLCLQKNHDIRYKILSIFLCIIYPFWHPITAIVICIYLIVWFCTERFNFILKVKIKPLSLTLLIISIVCLTAWFVNQYSLIKDVKTIILQLINLLQTPSTAAQAEYYAKKLGLLSAVKSLYLMINDDIIFYILSFASIFDIMKKNNNYKINFVSLLACFVIGNIFLLIMFFSARIHTPERLINLNFNMIFTPLLVGWFLYNAVSNKQKSKLILVIFLIFVSVGTSIISLYPSPITMRPNDQVTLKEIKGMNWLISKKNIDLKTADVMSPVCRYADLLFGYNYRLERKDLYREPIILDHFGLQDKSIFPVEKDKYLTITKFDIESYTKVWEDINRFKKEDFDKIEISNNVNRIYDNGELKNYLIWKL